jgi:cell division protein FtsN
MKANRPYGRTLIGFVTGLVIGLVIAVIAAVLVTNAPVPFLNKVQRPADTVQPGPDGKLPDPNKGLYTPPITKPDLSAPGVTKIDPPLLPPPQAKAEPKAETEVSRYLLQAGAFKTAEDADGMRARLAMLGLDARIYPVEQSGATLYRVRIGPYGQIDEVNKARKLLAENNIDAQVVRVR